MTVVHREVTCDSPVGFGAELMSVGGPGSNPVLSGGCAPPAVDAVKAAGLLSTRMHDMVVLTGSGFGIAVRQLRVTYGPTGREYEAVFDPRAGLAQSHGEIHCHGAWRGQVPGMARGGGGSGERDGVAGRAHPAPPRQRAGVVGAAELVTSGWQSMLLRGDHFGPPTPRPGGHGAFVVTYGPTGTEFRGTACAVGEGRAQITCASAADTGIDDRCWCGWCAWAGRPRARWPPPCATRAPWCCGTRAPAPMGAAPPVASAW